MQIYLVFWDVDNAGLHVEAYVSRDLALDTVEGECDAEGYKPVPAGWTGDPHEYAPDCWVWADESELHGA